jgi:putative transposase
MDGLLQSQEFLPQGRFQYSESEVEFSQSEEFYMKNSRFSDSQIMDALKWAEAGFKMPDLRRELDISSALFYRWRTKFFGMNVSIMLRIKELEE